MKKDFTVCPICQKKVSELEPSHGGTRTDSRGYRYHRDCVNKKEEEEQEYLINKIK